ncbi:MULTISPECIES: hypothetical protein [Sphingobacterium]|uniref:hypothetical protein n=1 Tax=Sphingobacterium TaxID=28453 RepID=UPI00118189F0|nr:hypothetical protein [Sphingobacterium sp. 1.A.4]
MKNLKKLMFGLVALGLAFGLMFSVSAFKAKKATFTYWRYDLNTQVGARSGFNYTQITNPSAPGCDDGEEMPCVIQVDESIDTQAKLNTYLSTNFPNEAAVTAAALHTKSN